MAKRELYRKAIELRLKGHSYSEILQEVAVSKSTLSLWLNTYKLTPKQTLRLKDKKYLQIERFRLSMKKKREERLKLYLNEEKNKLFPLSKREMFFLGLGLYWGEGNKASRNTLSINNTDPNVIRYSLLWYTQVLDIPLEKIRVAVHLYSDMDINNELEFWSQYLEIPRSQFSKPYIKKSTRSLIDQKGFGHGTCGLQVSNTVLKEHILMDLTALSEQTEFVLI